MKVQVSPFMSAIVIAALALPASPQRNNNDWMRQQQQQDQMRRQQDMQRQQMQEQQRQQQRQQMQEQQRQQQRQQMQEQQRQQQRQQMQEQQRQQQRQQMQGQQRQQAQEQQRQQAQEQQRQQSLDQQRQQSRQQQQKQQTQQHRQGQTASRQAEPQRLKDRTVYSNGIAKLKQPPTLAEMKRGFTGRVTPDGRALVRVRGRVYSVPASRIGVRVPPRQTEPGRIPANDNRKQAFESEARRLASAKVAPKKAPRRVLGFLGGPEPKLDAKPLSFSRSDVKPKYVPDEKDPKKMLVVPPVAWDKMQGSAIVGKGRKPSAAEVRNGANNYQAWVAQRKQAIANGDKHAKVYPLHDGFVAKDLKTLASGSYLMRVGDQLGGFTSPAGESPDRMALPPEVRKQPITYYKVVKSLPVLAGEAADHNGLQGGAQQFMHSASIEDLLKLKMIVPVSAEEARGKTATFVEPANDR